MTQDTFQQTFSVITFEDSKNESKASTGSSNAITWGSLPTVILLEIHKYLPLKDRLNAFAVCRNWRLPAFQVPLSEELNLIWESEQDTEKLLFLTEKFAHKTPKVSITFNGSKLECLDLMGQVFRQLENNMKLQSLKIRCSESSLCNEIFYGVRCSDLITRQYFIHQVIKPVLKILKGRNELKYFSFPLIDELKDWGSTFFTVLSQTTKQFYFRQLHLTSLRNFSTASHYNTIQFAESCVPRFNLNPLANFLYLQAMSLDHDVLTDAILSKIGINSRTGGLKRFNITVYMPNALVTNEGWTQFSANNPDCGIRLTVIGQSAARDLGTEILFPSIRLTHFRALYCKGIRLSCLNSLIRWNKDILQHLEVVDENYEWMDYILQSENLDENQFLDPIIYAAWRCEMLQTIIIGFMYCGHSLVGIARLRGKNLTRLEIPKSQVVYPNLQQLSTEVSDALGRSWKPIDDTSDRKMFRMKPTQKKLKCAYRALLTNEQQ